MKAGLTALLALALSVALLACGDSNENEAADAQIVTVTDRFSAAVANQDAEAFCELLAPNDVQKLGEGGSDGMEECLVVWGKDRNPLFGSGDPELEIESISHKGPYATAQLTNGGELGYAKEGGRWYVHLAPERSE